MKSLTKNIVLLNIVLAVVLVGCEKTIDFNGEKSDPLTVVNSIITPDSLFWVEVSKSLHISDAVAFPKVVNAGVDIYENGKFVSTLKHLHDGFYSGDFKPVAGKEYEIKVETGEVNVSAKTTIPETVKITSLKLDSVQDQDGMENTELTLRFNDPEEMKNYYKVSALVVNEYAAENNGEYAVATDSYWAKLSSNDRVIVATFGQQDAFDDSSINSYSIFTDDLINGVSYDLKVLTNTSGYANNTENKVTNIKYVVYLNSISEEYFYYLKSRSKNSWYKDDPFSEPMPIYSNIKGGVGILGAYSAFVDSISVVNDAK